MEKGTINREWVKSQVEAYAGVYPRYVKLEDTIQQILEKAVEKLAPLTIVQSRTKTISSFTGKVLRKRIERANPVLDFTDLCGARIIVVNREHIELFCNFVKENFDIDWDNSLDVSQRLKENEFGYRSIHYIVSLNENSFSTGDIKVEIPKDVLPDREAQMKAEIQVRTMLEHCWAECSHDISYKGHFKLPTSLQRELAVAAAVLENTDNTLTKIGDTIKTYYSNYESYMTIKEIEEELAIREIILENSPNDFRIAHSVGKLALATENLEKAIEVMEKFADSEYHPILRDLGIAITKFHKNDRNSAEYKRGQQYLAKAIEICDTDIDAISSLAGTYKRIDDKKVLEYYRMAFEIEPGDPYVLGNYLEYETKARDDPSIISLMLQPINTTIDRCWEMIEVETNFPWAFFDLGKFYLLAGKPYMALLAYLRAIQHSTAPFMIQTSLNSLLNLEPAVKNGFESVSKILKMGKYVKFKDKDALNEMHQMSSISGEKFGESVVLVVGSCDEKEEVKLQKYYHQLIDAFRDYSGTIISGGTRSGISKIVGDIQEYYGDRIKTIGYIPEDLPDGVEIDKRYGQIRTTGKTFDPVQPIQYWIDVLTAGVDPGSVKVLAVGGSALSAFEIMLSLVLGADAVVLAGAEVDLEAHSNTLWNNQRKIITLPNEKFSLRAFIGTGIKAFPEPVREQLAVYLHNKYRASYPPNMPYISESMLDWSDLPEYLKKSNREAVDHIIQKLGEIGYTIEETEVADKSDTIMFSDSEIEILAEMEHARWLTERLMQGWEYSPQKDVENRKHPYIVVWDRLDNEAKKIDRSLVKDIPWQLADFNIKVVKKT